LTGFPEMDALVHVHMLGVPPFELLAVAKSASPETRPDPLCTPSINDQMI
jgi:hypothetical protein